ncbi:MAG: (d)CMP kinase [Bacteroidota bacterium]
MNRITIAIDGYSACGKSTTAKRVAAILGYRYIDSGAMYRAVTLHFLENHVSVTNPKEVTKALEAIKISFQVNAKGVSETFLNGLNVEGSIREMRISENVSQVSTLKAVRTAMVEQQRKLGKHRGVVMDGRDIGTVVFPDAELKLFLTADIYIRAARRQQELLQKGEMIDLEDIVANLKKRDQIDSTRAESPLVKAEGAVEIDTSFVTIDEQVDEVIQLALGRILAPTHEKISS